jgi:type IV secretory pathway ATPase VirB11/archaellum biosynthesis ATPase
MEAADPRAAVFREHPPEWWGWPWRLPRPLSIAELIAAGSLDARLAGLLWVALERRASLLVVAGPNGAGKTVTLSALLDFLPPGVRRVHLQGMAEDFAFVPAADPATTYLLCNEISDHLPIYLWGRRVRRLFELLGQGFGLGATLHATGVEEALRFLRAPPLAIPDALLAQVTLVATLAVEHRRQQVVRRVAAVHVIEAGPSGAGYGSAPAL